VARTLDAEAKSEFQRHLETCSKCREAVAAQEAVWSALDAWHPVAGDSLIAMLESVVDRALSPAQGEPDNAEIGRKRLLAKMSPPGKAVQAFAARPRARKSVL
jgi:anti-sigma factor RsiW